MKRTLLAALALAGASGGAAEIVTLAGRAMGTKWTARFEAGAAGYDPDSLRRRIADRLEALEQQLSIYRPASALSRFNASTHTEWFPVPVELARVAAEARRVAALTGGAFDPTVFPLVRLWGFGPEGRTGTVPPPAEILVARERIGWSLLEVRVAPPALRRAQAGITADFSSTAKGFAADAVGTLLDQAGLPRHVVQVGGDVRVGAAPEGQPGWAIAIEEPVEERGGVACIVALADSAVSTSGDYRNFFRAGGQRYGHIIDPRSGLPPQGDLASATVIHHSSATASSLATGLFVLGPEAGWRLALEERLAALFIVRRGSELEQVSTPEFDRWRKAH